MNPASLTYDTLDLLNKRGDQLKVLFYFIALWTCVLSMLNQNLPLKGFTRPLGVDVRTRIVAMIHGLMALCLAFYIILNEWPKYNSNNTEDQTLLMLLSAAYFIYDTIECIYYNQLDMATGLHHPLALLGYFSSLYCKSGGSFVAMGVFYAEISNLPMHMRVICKNFNLRYTKLYEFCELSYFALYFIFRGLFVPIMVLQGWREEKCPLMMKLMAIGLLAQSIVYMFDMKDILKRKYLQYQEREQKNIEYYWFSLNPKIDNLSFRKFVIKENIF